MEPTRILICKNVKISSQLVWNSKRDIKWNVPPISRETTKEWYMYQVFRREATIWNIAACLIKGNYNQALKHAPACCLQRYMGEARKRIEAIEAWIKNHPAEAKALVKEYDENRKEVMANAKA